MMDLRSAFSRARRGFREDARLYVVAVTSLTVAFLCLGVALIFTTNLSRVAERWRGAARMTVYLKDDAAGVDVERLRGALEKLPEARSVELITPESAKEAFLRDTQLGDHVSGIADDVFPASLEVSLRAGSTPARIQEIAGRVERFGAVEGVETYRSFFDRLDSFLNAGQALAGIVGLLVLICVFAVVGNTIRLAVTNRRDEIEVLKLCGATDGFVRGPFLVEGALQGLVSSTLALVFLFFGFLEIRSHIDSTFITMSGFHISFLHPWAAIALVGAGMLGGMLGSSLSLRRYLVI